MIGRVVCGDYSFLKAHAVAFGYVLLKYLKLIKCDGIILLKSPTKNIYHQAILKIYATQMEI